MIEDLIQQFIDNIKSIESDIYNEFSLQHELGIYLRNNLPKEYKVQFERNVSFFSAFEDIKDFVKKEVDIVVYKNDFSEKYAIELKYPKNGQYPETMYSFIKDIRFMEQVKQKLNFNNTFVFTIVTDKNFFEGSYPSEIYKYFRGNTKSVSDIIHKPTGKNDEFIEINGSYKIDWKKTNSIFTYYQLKI